METKDLIKQLDDFDQCVKWARVQIAAGLFRFCGPNIPEELASGEIAIGNWIIRPRFPASPRMSPKEFAERMFMILGRCQRVEDQDCFSFRQPYADEEEHCAATKLMGDLLKSLGYEAGVEIYNKANKHWC